MYTKIPFFFEFFFFEKKNEEKNNRENVQFGPDLESNEVVQIRMNEVRVGQKPYQIDIGSRW